jgi:LysM repeat protein
MAGSGIICPVIDDPTPAFEVGPSACPFVAFEDDRDHRSSSPDYRHRCFAAPEPEPRAFPHQERFCLSADFPRCPIFLDWARQEAAGVKAGGGEPASVPAAASVAAVDIAEQEAAPAFLAARPRATVTVPAEIGASSKRAADVGAGLWSYDGDTATRSPAPKAPLPPSSLGEPSVAMARRGPTHPGWENPPRVESFPRLRSREDRRANQPLLFVAIGMALVMASLVLFPIVMNAKGPGAGASGSAAALLPVATDTPLVTAPPTPAPTFLIYYVKKTDVLGLSGIAAKFNVTLDDLIAANPKLKPPYYIWENLQLNIPPIGWKAPTPAPS